MSVSAAYQLPSAGPTLSDRVGYRGRHRRGHTRPMSGEHHYRVTTTWIGDRGTGTSGYRDYDRTVRIGVDGKPDVIGSADPAFRGDATHHNPEDLLLIAISQCHLLSYLHACVTRGVVVTGYTDEASAVMAQEATADISPRRRCARRSRLPTSRWSPTPTMPTATPTSGVSSRTRSTSRSATTPPSPSADR